MLPNESLPALKPAEWIGEFAPSVIVSMCLLPDTVQPATVPGLLYGHVSKSPLTRGKVVGVGTGVGVGATMTETVSPNKSGLALPRPTSVKRPVVALLLAVKVRK